MGSPDEPLPFTYGGGKVTRLALSAGDARLVLHALHKEQLSNMRLHVEGQLARWDMETRNDAIDEIAQRIGVTR